MKKIKDVIADNLCDDAVIITEDEPKTKNKVLKIFAIIGVVAAVAGIAYALYRYFKPDYLEDCDEDEDDDEFFDDDEK